MSDLIIGVGGVVLCLLIAGFGTRAIERAAKRLQPDRGVPIDTDVDFNRLRQTIYNLEPTHHKTVVDTTSDEWADLGKLLEKLWENSPAYLEHQNGYWGTRYQDWLDVFLSPTAAATLIRDWIKELRAGQVCAFLDSRVGGGCFASRQPRVGSKRTLVHMVLYPHIATKPHSG